MTRTTSAAAVLAVLVALAPVGARAAGGAPDPSFSRDGRIVLDLGYGVDAAGRDVLIRGSGKVVVASAVETSSGTAFAITQLRRNGKPDPYFHGTGTRVTSFTGQDVPRRVVNLGGRSLVGGSAGGAFALAVYRGDGSLDRSFGTRGKVVTSVTDGVDEIRDVLVTRQGEVLAAGVAGDRFAVARYREDGTLDPAFGDGGVVTTATGFSSVAETVRLQRDGRLLVAGASEPDGSGNRGFAVMRFDRDGSVDTTFGGGDGLVTTWFNEGTPTEEASRAVALLEQPGGLITAVGSTYGEGDYRSWSIARYRADGSRDPSFGGGDGKVKLLFQECCYGQIEGVARQKDGRIVAVGWTRESSSSPGRFAVARFTAAGKLDPSFSKDGKAVVGFGSQRSALAATVACRLGRVVAAGQVVGRGGRSQTTVADLQQ